MMRPAASGSRPVLQPTSRLAAAVLAVTKECQQRIFLAIFLRQRHQAPDPLDRACPDCYRAEREKEEKRRRRAKGGTS